MEIIFKKAKDKGNQMKTPTVKQLLVAIKKNCVECCGSIYEARKCEIKECPLYEFRPGSGATYLHRKKP